ncbi:MAG: (d)CMP kinase [Yaniella sp.]|nr:(d)CMP kinase [Yaniella sp.]
MEGTLISAQPLLVIAIDGPSGTGKTTIARWIAKELNLSYLDTGANYRAATLWCMKNGLDLSQPDSVDTQQITELITTMPLAQDLNPHNFTLALDGQDITDAIRSDEVTSNVSVLSTRTEVREHLVELQRQAIQSRPRIVVEGRDITTVVAPDAEARILLTASPEVRMARRGQQLRETNQDPGNVESDVIGRDEKDSALVDFMTPAEGVVEIDSSILSLEDTVTVVLAEIQRQVNTNGS